MHLAYAEDEEQLRQRLRAYYSELLDPQIRRDLHHSQGIGPGDAAGRPPDEADGWLGVGWPAACGSQGTTLRRAKSGPAHPAERS